MMRRLREALLRDASDQLPNRPLRPNELRRDVAREERLRRETHRVERPANQQTPAAEEQRPRRESPPAPPAPAPARRRYLSALETRSSLRQAWLLNEILGPPIALRGPNNGT